jgi:hypothetical protein
MPNTEFVIDSNKKAQIAVAFGLTLESVEDLYTSYVSVAAKIKKQYLAHMVRAMEDFFKEKTRNTNFHIICEPFKEIVPGQKNGLAQYYRGSKFVIYYNNTISETRSRMYIAHELGHLFLIALNDVANRRDDPMYEGTTEPLSSIFGIFTIADKNDFYQNIAASGRNHPTWDSLLADFLQIHKE